MASRRGKPNMSPEQLQMILQLTALGVPQKTAAANVGVTPGAISNRKDRDPAFSVAFEQARAKYTVGVVGNMRRWGQKDWRAEAWLAERLLPEIFARPEVRAQLQMVSVDQKALVEGIHEHMARSRARHIPPDAVLVDDDMVPGALPPEEDPPVSGVARS
jgi:hypothetical protein